MQVAVLDGDLLQPPVVQLVAELEEAGPVVGMDALEEELHLLDAQFGFRRQPEQIPQPGIEIGGALLVVHFVEPETGELGTGVEPRLARAQCRFAAPALGDVDAEAGEPLGLAVGRPADAAAR